MSAAEEQNVSELFFAFCGEPSGEESLFLDYLCDGHQHFEVEVSLVQGADHQEGCFDVGLFRVEDDPVLAPNDDQIESAFSGNDRMGDRQARLKDGAALGFAMLEGLTQLVGGEFHPIGQHLRCPLKEHFSRYVSGQIQHGTPQQNFVQAIMPNVVALDGEMLQFRFQRGLFEAGLRQSVHEQGQSAGPVDAFSYIAQVPSGEQYHQYAQRDPRGGHEQFRHLNQQHAVDAHAQDLHPRVERAAEEGAVVLDSAGPHDEDRHVDQQEDGDHERAGEFDQVRNAQ